MDSRLLNNFIVAAEGGNLTAAARKLNVTQSALTRQIQKLEGLLGVRLLERNGKRVKISVEAEALLPRMNAVLSASRQLQDGANDLRKEATGLLRVGACAQLVERYFPEVLARWRAMAPKVEIRVEEGGGFDLNTKLLDGALHLAVNAGSYALSGEVEAVIVGRLHIQAVGSAAALGRSAEPIDIVDLCAKPILALSRRHASRAMFDAACHLAGLAPTIAMESASIHTLLWMAASDLGVAVVPVVRHQEAGPIASRPVAYRGEPLGFDIAAMWPRRYALPSYGRRFVSVIEDVILGHQRQSPGLGDNVIALPERRLAPTPR